MNRFAGARTQLAVAATQIVDKPKRRRKGALVDNVYHNIESVNTTLPDASTREAIRRDNMRTIADPRRFRRTAGVSDFERRTWSGYETHPMDTGDEPPWWNPFA